VNPDNVVNQDREENQDHKVQLDLLDQQDPEENLDRQDSLDLWDQQAL